MFRHVVMFRWADHVGTDDVADVSGALDTLPALIPEIRGYHHGPDAGVNPGNFDYVVVGDFDTVDDYVVYRDHPEHRTVVSERIAPRVTDRAAVQYHLGD